LQGQDFGVSIAKKHSQGWNSYWLQESWAIVIEMSKNYDDDHMDDIEYEHYTLVTFASNTAFAIAVCSCSATNALLRPNVESRVTFDAITT